MTTAFDAAFIESGFSMLIEQFGESITYAPHNGAVRVIDAIVEREPGAVLDAAGNAVLPSLTVRVYNSTTEGISSAELNVGKDELILPLKVNDSGTHRFSVMTLVSQDAGVTHLAVK